MSRVFINFEQFGKACSNCFARELSSLPSANFAAIGFGIGNSAVNHYTFAACSADLCLAFRKTRRLASTMGDLLYDQAAAGIADAICHFWPALCKRIHLPAVVGLYVTCGHRDD